MLFSKVKQPNGAQRWDVTSDENISFYHQKKKEEEEKQARKEISLKKREEAKEKKLEAKRRKEEAMRNKEEAKKKKEQSVEDWVDEECEQSGEIIIEDVPENAQVQVQIVTHPQVKQELLSS